MTKAFEYFRVDNSSHKAFRLSGRVIGRHNKPDFPDGLFHLRKQSQGPSNVTGLAQTGFSQVYTDSIGSNTKEELTDN